MQSLLILSTLLLGGCAMNYDNSDWDHLNYTQIACGNDHKSPGCKPEDDNMSNISKGGKSSGR